MMTGWRRWIGVAAMAAFTVVQAETVRIATLNVEWFPGQRPEPTEEAVTGHVAAVRAALAELKPDILIATEVSDPAVFRDVVKEATDLDLHVISNFAASEDNPDRRQQQIAIAAKLPAVAGWAEDWKPTLPDLRRGFSFAALRNPATGRLLMTYGLHLKSNRSRTPEEAQLNYDLRDASISQLLDHMRQMETEYAEYGIDGWIVAGDFNTNHDGRFGDHVIASLVDAGFWNSFAHLPPDDRHTWKAYGNFQATTFDYVMTRGLGSPLAHVVVMDDSVSDHNAVVLDINLADLPQPTEPVAPAEEPEIPLPPESGDATSAAE